MPQIQISDAAYARLLQFAQANGVSPETFIEQSLTGYEEAEDELSNLRVKLARAQELGELRSSFLSMLSHEFRTPLAVILSSSELLRNYADRINEQRRQEHLTRIKAHVRHLTGLVDAILTFERAESRGLPFAPTMFNLEYLCMELVEEVQFLDDHKHVIRFEAGGDCDHVTMDDKLMRLALSNLLTNAVKYSDDKTQITLGLQCVEDNRIQIQVRDQGRGIPAEDVAHIFELFRRGSNVGGISGTGLGLALVHQIVVRHQGTITCESVMGVGTAFTITLPRVVV